uniref:SHNi TPR n=1 Tax=Tremella fuciformis TaxID=64657 RepID=D5KY45_9TREE|nr:SHNi TPR [Tremella fuciformis]
MRGIVGEFDPAMAPLLLSYGKALFELAVSTQGALGKEELDKQAGAEVSQIEDESSGNLVESAEFEPEAEGEPSAEDAAPEAGAPEPEGGEEGGEDVDEPEDDYNAAWEVLDVARTIYSKIVEDGGSDDDKLNLAECYISLGDVSCETENFSQAVQDYTSALALKEPLLASSSRALASVHYQLASVLEFTPNRRSDALSHVEKALEGFQARKVQLESASPEAPDVVKMSQKEKEAELGDVKALIGDLEAKIEELKAAPEAKDFVSESINHLLGGIGSDAGPSGSAAASGEPAKVNDLSGLVKKKPAKKAAPPPPATNGNGTEGESDKRKAEDEAGGQEKKLKA